MLEVGLSLSVLLPFLILFNPVELTLQFKNVISLFTHLFFPPFIDLACARVIAHKITLAVLSVLLESFFLKQIGFLHLVKEEVITFLPAFHNNIDTPLLGSLFTTPTVIGPDIRIDSMLT